VIAFLYARVSTGEQNEGMQLREMQEYAARAGWKTEIFPDVGVSGAKDRRPELDRMMALVRRRKCDVVLVYKFDRFARSLRFLVNALAEFDALGVAFVSVRDNIDTTLPAGRLMFHVIGAIAEFERSLIAERVKSGLQEAKKQLEAGKPTHRGKTRWAGRPGHDVDTEQIHRLRANGHALRAIAKTVGISEASVRRALKSPPRLRQKGVVN